MSTTGRREPAPPTLPPLVSGERLDRATFHERYEAMPPQTRAELIGGVVHMPSPLSQDHGFNNGPVAYWMMHYQRFTKGVRTALNASVFLDARSEPQPDLLMIIRPELGGQSWVDSKYLAGPPELVVEISKSSRRIDLGPKFRDYDRAGVREYLVVALDPNEIHWFARREGKLMRMEPSPDGIYRSEVFPGLWLDPAALFAEDLDGLTAALDRGLASPEHAEFVARLARAGG